MHIRNSTAHVETTLDAILSEARRSILNQIKLSKEDKLIYQELAVLDSLNNHLGDSSQILLQTLASKLRDFSQEYQKADSIWTNHLAQEEANQVRQYAIDPATITVRLPTHEEQQYSLPYDTVAQTIVEAEAAFAVGALAKYSQPGYQGLGYVDYIHDSGDFIEWKIATQRAGQHILSFHYIHGGGSDRPLAISVDSVIVDSVVSFPSAGQGNWADELDTQGLAVFLDSGVYTVRATAIGSSGANIDHLKMIGPTFSTHSPTVGLTWKVPGVVDSAGIATLVRNAAERNHKVGMMNGIEIILEYSISQAKRALQDIVDKNEHLMHQDIARLRQNLQQTNLFNFLTLSVVALLTILATYAVLRSLRISIARPVEQIKRLSAGETDRKIDATHDELNAVVQASNQLSDRLNWASDFAREIGKGNLQHDFQPSSEKDVLGNALIQMRDQLQAIALADQRRNWQNDGLAKFSELLRKEYQDKQALASCVISNLVKYTSGNQGGLFFYNDQGKAQPYLELIGCYAYDRKKYLKKEVALGEGLLGQAFLGRETTYLIEIPDDYITIGSGLGGDNPKSLLIVPVSTDKHVEGMIELASFREFADHEIVLIEKVALILATRISEMRTSEQTRALLSTTQLQAEQLREQKDELPPSIEK